MKKNLEISIFILFVFLQSISRAGTINEELLTLYLKSCNIDVIYQDEMEAARRQFLSHGREAAEFLTTQLGTKIARERFVMREILFPGLGEQSINALLPVLDTAETDIASFAAYCIGKVLAKNRNLHLPAERLSAFLKNPDWHVRDRICFALAYCTPSSDVADTLSELISIASNETVRKSAVHTLGLWKLENTIPVLLNSLEDNYFGVRMAACLSLANWNCSRVDSALLKAFPDANLKAKRLILRILASRDQFNYEVLSESLTINLPILKMEVAQYDSEYFQLKDSTDFLPLRSLDKWYQQKGKK